MEAAKVKTGSHIFGIRVADASRYGVIEIDQNGEVLSLEEKPQNPRSDLAVVGLYFFDNRVVEIARHVEPSSRGELEITGVIQAYIDDKSLQAHILPRGLTWLDTGTHESMMQASQYVHAVEEAAQKLHALKRSRLIRMDIKIRCGGYGRKHGWWQLFKIFETNFK